jgi:O-antigen/teichoic acid export membrane protein
LVHQAATDRMSLKRNITANVLSRVWSALMSFAFVPFYVRFLGPEAYGLIGFFATMMAVFAVLDMGLSMTVNRELARADGDDEVARARDLVRSLEYIYWLIAVIIGVVCFSAAGFIAEHWLQGRTLSVETAARAVQLMGLTAMLRWPSALYNGALIGLRRQVVLNIVVMVAATLQGGGAVLVLWLVSPTIEAFFGWQLIVAGAQIAALVFLAWHFLALPGHRPSFNTGVLRSVLMFSSGVFAIILSSVVLTQSDKILLSRYLTLEQFGYYTLAAAVASVLATTAVAINNAVFPEMARIHARSDGNTAIADFYHLCAQFMSLVIIPAGLTLAFFSYEFLSLYLGDSVVVSHTYVLLSVWALANTVYALIVLPNSLQLASGWTSLALSKNLIGTVVYLPVLVVLIKGYGAVGGVIAWLLLVMSYFLIEPVIMHRRLIPQEIGRWYLRDVGRPLAISVVALGGARLLAVPSLPVLARIAIAAGGALFALLASAAMLPEIRNRAVAMFRQQIPALQHRTNRDQQTSAAKN